MAEYLHTTPGSVSALELMFDSDHHIQLVMDKPLTGDEYISAHPGLSTSTLRLTREDLLKFVRSTGHEPIIVDLPVEEEERENRRS